MSDAATPNPVRQPLLRFVPEPRLALAIAVTAPLWLLPTPWGRYAGIGVLVSLAAGVVADLFLLPSKAGLVVEREVPQSVGLGDTVPGKIRVHNVTSQPLRITLGHTLPAVVGGTFANETFALPARSMHAIPLDITGEKRGEADVEPIGVRVRTRLGLVAARFRYDAPASIRVVPSVTGVRRFRLLAMQHRLNVLGVRNLRRKGEGQGFASLREYMLGDEPRHIDWKATARRAKLITREFTIERSQTLITLIDAGRSMTQLAGTYSRFEQALNAALVLTDVAVNAGDRVGTLVFDDDVRAYVPALLHRGALRVIREAYVPLAASTREPDYARAFRFLAAHQRKRALVVFFTDVIDVRASQALVAHVSRSTARHLTLVVALRNDDVFAAAVPHAEKVGDIVHAYEHAAAEEIIQARDEALERMRRAGAVVVDVSPQVMTASVVNRYLELKGRGAI